MISRRLGDVALRFLFTGNRLTRLFCPSRTRVSVTSRPPCPVGRTSFLLPGTRTLPEQLLDLEDKRQLIQEPLIVAPESPQSPPASSLNELPCGGPCEPRRPFLLPILPPLLHLLINSSYSRFGRGSALIEGGH
ncbi:hypothetical protein D5F01_LYC16095 [Xyrichtys novacula]|uniref:Uncharacterized protein n=1 Tax=Xyrichtys novacula TaxID=13765 RepID=A0AAV1FDW1_XYRNO|nr:hypothetical protein D5F01_LYC16095 [Xyrichtys novacula]